MRRATRRSPRSRWLLTLAALGALIAGYYLGQHWQRQPLEQLSATVFTDGHKARFPEGLGLDTPEEQATWRLFLVADTREPACRSALPRFGLMMNRLAAWPKIQARVRLTVLAYDSPPEAEALDFRGGAPWIDVVGADKPDLDALAADLGILPDGFDWCTPTQLTSVLVDPNQRRWALIPYEEPKTMAHNVQAVIQFVE